MKRKERRTRGTLRRRGGEAEMMVSAVAGQVESITFSSAEHTQMYDRAMQNDLAKSVIHSRQLLVAKWCAAAIITIFIVVAVYYYYRHDKPVAPAPATVEKGDTFIKLKGE